MFGDNDLYASAVDGRLSINVDMDYEDGLCKGSYKEYGLDVKFEHPDAGYVQQKMVELVLEELKAGRGQATFF